MKNPKSSVKIFKAARILFCILDLLLIASFVFSFYVPAVGGLSNGSAAVTDMETAVNSDEVQTHLPVGEASEEDEDVLSTPAPVKAERRFDLKNRRSVLLIAAILLILVLIAILSVLIDRIEKEMTLSAQPTEFGGTKLSMHTRSRHTPTNKNGVCVGMIHNQGKRENQEDSLGTDDSGQIYIVADGMGGLEAGEKVSQTIVYTMLTKAQTLRKEQFDGVLPEMVDQVNETVNKMLGKDGIYRSGSTLLAVLLKEKRFHWIAIGDSHIYFYHRNILNQLNQEHNLRQENLRRVLAGEMTKEEAASGKNLSGLTSFVGMGTLKYVEKSISGIPFEEGDRILLMTDGVFNELSEAAIAEILFRYPDVQEAANQMERAVLSRADPHQDNFTALIIGV